MRKTPLKSLFGKLLRESFSFKNLLIFFLLFFGSHFLWKMVVHGNLTGHDIRILSFDATPLFYALSKFTARSCWELLTLCGVRPLVLNGTVIHYIHPGGSAVNIIWGCTAVKQLLMFLIVMLFSAGPWKLKTIYIPVGLLVLWIYNLIRICTITYFTGIDSADFDYWHSLFNAPYYALIFLLWVLWEEGVNHPLRKKKLSVRSQTA